MQFEAVPDDVPRLGERPDMPQGQRLPQHVAHRGGIRRSDDDRALHGIGREMIQQGVGRGAEQIEVCDPRPVSCRSSFSVLRCSRATLSSTHRMIGPGLRGTD